MFRLITGDPKHLLCWPWALQSGWKTHPYVCISAGKNGGENVPVQVTNLAECQLMSVNGCIQSVFVSGRMGMHVVHVFACLWG